MRSSLGMKALIAFSVVVLPVPVPPEIRTFSLPFTHAARNCADRALSVPNEIRSLTVYGSRENFRMVSVGPFSESGGMIALTRLPSGRRASTIGEDSSTRRPTCETILSMIRRTCDSSTKRTSLSSSFPWRSTYTRSYALTMTSVTESSRSSGSIGP